MGRQIHTGLDYFPFEKGFFNDIKVRKLIKYQGGRAALVYIDLLCRIYGDRGYYILWDEELPFIISDDLGSGYDEGYVLEVIKTCVTIGLFDECLFQSGVISSAAIQSRYKKACETSKRKATIGLYNLLAPPVIPFDNAEEIRIPSEEIWIPSEEMLNNSEEMQQRKGKKIKENTPPISDEIAPPPDEPGIISPSVPARPKTLEERKHEFGLSLVPYMDKYGKEMIRDFFDYWSEVSDGGNKMAWEKAKTKKGTFNIAGRLATWKRHEDNGYGGRSSRRGSTISEAVQATIIPDGGSAQLDITKLLGK